MKKYKLYLFIALFALLNMGCKKRCLEVKPEPVIMKDTVQKITTGVPIAMLLKPNASNGKDANIVQNILGADNNNYGSSPYIFAEAWTHGGGNQYYRTVIDFDLSTIPAGATVSQATLVLYADTTDIVHGGGTKADNGHSTLSGPNPWVVKRITTAWDETTVTWNTQPTTDNSTIINMPASTSRSQTYEVDVTQFVKDQIAHPTLYYGFMFSLASEIPYRGIAFCSSDHPYSILAPELKIAYTTK